MKHKYSILMLLLAGLIGWTGCGRQDAVIPTPETEGESGVMIIESEAAFTAQVIQSDRPVLVDFWATWCPPCRAMEPVIKTTAARHQDAIRVAKVDVDLNKDLAQSFNIRAVPTLMLYHQGEAIAVHEGAITSPSRLDQWIQQQLQQAGVSL